MMIDDDWWWLVMMMLLMVIRITDSSMFLFNIGCSRPFWFEYERHTLSFSEDCFLLRPGVTEIVSMTCGWKRFHQSQKMVELQWFKCMIPKMSQKMVWHPTILWLKGPPPKRQLLGRMLVEHLLSSQFCERFLGPTLGPVCLLKASMWLELEKKTHALQNQNKFQKKQV